MKVIIRINGNKLHRKMTFEKMSAIIISLIQVYANNIVFTLKVNINYLLFSFLHAAFSSI